MISGQTARGVLASTLPATDAEALGDEPRGWAAWLPDAKSLEWSSRSVKEVLGLAQVRMTTEW